MLSKVIATAGCISVALASNPFGFGFEYESVGPHSIFRIENVQYKMPQHTECASRHCDINIHVDVPYTDKALPLAIFSNGFQQDSDRYVSYTERLATWGYVAIRWDMKENALNYPTHRSRGLMAGELISWARTQSENPSSPLYKKIDTSKVFLAGHSAGGKSSFVASQEHQLGAIVKGIFAIDPVDCPPPTERDYSHDFPSTIRNMNNTMAKAAYIGSALGANGVQPCAPPDCSYEQYFKATPSGTWSIMISESGHEQFYDNYNNGICRAGKQDPAIIQHITKTAMIAWAEHTMRDKNIDHYLYEWGQDMHNIGVVKQVFKWA